MKIRRPRQLVLGGEVVKKISTAFRPASAVVSLVDVTDLKVFR